MGPCTIEARDNGTDGNSDIMETCNDNGKERNNNITGSREVYREIGPRSGLWIPRERFESRAGAMM